MVWHGRVCGTPVFCHSSAYVLTMGKAILIFAGWRAAHSYIHTQTHWLNYTNIYILILYTIPRIIDMVQSYRSPCHNFIDYFIWKKKKKELYKHNVGNWKTVWKKAKRKREGEIDGIRLGTAKKKNNNNKLAIIHFDCCARFNSSVWGSGFGRLVQQHIQIMLPTTDLCISFEMNVHCMAQGVKVSHGFIEIIRIIFSSIHTTSKAIIFAALHHRISEMAKSTAPNKYVFILSHQSGYNIINTLRSCAMCAHGPSIKF